MFVDFWIIDWISELQIESWIDWVPEWLTDSGIHSMHYNSVTFYFPQLLNTWHFHLCIMCQYIIGVKPITGSTSEIYITLEN